MRLPQDSAYGPAKVLPESSPPAAEQPPPDGGIASGPLDLDRLLEMAAARHPTLAAARARVEAAQGQLIQAGLYPNPTVGWRSEQINLRANKDDIAQHGPFVTQEIVTAGKLEIAQAAAAHGVTAADWQAAAAWYDVRARVQSAYYELVAAHRLVQEGQDLVAAAEQAIATADRLLKAGTVMPSDVTRAKVELAQSRNRLGQAQKREQAGRRLLATALGLAELPGPLVDADLGSAPPDYRWPELAPAVLSRAAEVREAQANVLQAQERLKLAEAQVCPNVEVSVRPAYDVAERSLLLFLEAGVQLPLYNKNQGNIRAAQAEVVRAEAEVGQVRLRLQERLAAAYQRYDNARRQASLYEKETLPLARQALAQVRQVYEAQGERYFDVLDAQRVLAQVRLDYIDVLGELWKAVTEIESLLQRHDLHPGPPAERAPPK